MLLARRNLTRDPVRLALSVSGVALSVALILLLAGYRAGIDAQASAYLDHTPGNAVVAERGIVDFLGTTSTIPTGVQARVAALAGAERVIPVVSQFVIIDAHGRKDGFFLVGYDPAAGGGPWNLVAGRQPTADDELVLDATAARQHGIAIGQPLRVLDRDMTVVGLSGGTTFWSGSIAFARITTLESMLRAPALRSFLLVTTQPGVSVSDLRASVAPLGVDVVAKADMIAADRKLLARVYDAPIGLMVAIAFAVGVLTVGIVIYTATIERRREYGALKAIGARNAVLYRVVLLQALIAASIGGVGGVLLAIGGGAVLSAWRPQFRVDQEPATVAVVLASTLLMAALAAIAPARSVAGLEPAEVVRG